MKKIVILLAALVLLFGFSGQALAAFANGDLIRVVYQNNGTVEVATDLGAMTSTSAFSNNVVYNTSNFKLSEFSAGTAYSNLNVGYFVYNGTNTNAWVSGPLTGQKSGASQGNNYQSASSNVLTYYKTLNADSLGNVKADQGAVNSYFSKMDKGQLGNAVMGGFIPAGNAEANLSALATVGYVDQILYYYGSANARTVQNGVALATIRTYADGHTELNPATANTPVPPSVLLLGSGLLGLVGLRRKMSV